MQDLEELYQLYSPDIYRHLCGLNTSNRLRNELADQLDTNRLCRDLKGRSPLRNHPHLLPGR